MIKSIVFLFIASFSGIANAQNPPAVVRDPQALQVLQNSLTAMGQSSSTPTLTSAIINATANLQRNDGNAIQESVTLSVAGNEFRADTVKPSGTTTYLTGHGSAKSFHNGLKKPLNYHVVKAAQPFFLPLWVLSKEFANTSCSVAYKGTLLVGGVKAIHIHLEDDSEEVSSIVTQQDWYFDPTTMLPLRVEYRMPASENALMYRSAAMQFSQYSQQGNVLMPMAISMYEVGQLTKTIAIQSVVLNQPIEPSHFDLNGGN